MQRLVYVDIEDNGRGLPEENRDRLTEPYVTTRAKGTGLGLAIVKKIMEDHNGDLLIEDRDGGGARVSLVFKEATGGARLAETAPRSSRSSSSRPMLPSCTPMANHQQAMTEDILIVDDEADIRTLVSGILEDEGYEAREAADSDETLAAVAVRRPSLILLDIWLQGSRLDGMQILEQLKQEHPSVPVVIMSGHGTIETAVQAIKLGAYDFIEKPFKADRMILVIRRAIEAARLKRENEELRMRAGSGLELIGQSALINQLRHSIDRVAPTNSRVLDFRPGRLRQGGSRPAHSRPLAPRLRPVRRPELRLDVARAHGSGAVRGRGAGRGRVRRARSAPSRRRTTARCCSTKWPTCRRRRRARSSAFCRSRSSSGSAARLASTSTSG